MTPNEQFTEFLRDPLNIPPEFKAWLVSYIEANPPMLPIGQIFGFAQFTAQAAPTAVAEETTASTSYTTLPSGPTLGGLPNGKYVVLFGGRVYVIGGSTAYISLSLNGAVPTDADSINWSSTTAATAPMQGWALLKTLSGNSNSLTLQYRLDAGTGHFLNRWLLAIKYSNI